MRDSYSRIVLGLALCSALVAAPRASAPSPGNSPVPSCISLVGTSGRVPAHAAGAFRVVVRDLANNPTVGAHVVVDQSGCPDLHFCADQLDPAMDVDGANGVGVNDASVWLTDFGTVGNPAFGRSDFDCSGDVGINDFSVLLTAFGSGTQVQSCGAACP